MFDAKPIITSIQVAGISNAIDVLRLDLVHPLISGNKWYKLKYNLQEAQKNGYKELLSFGGAYSNHLHALAYAAHLHGMKSIGIVRGETLENPTLDDCRQWGMQLHTFSRQKYRMKKEPQILNELHAQFPEAYIIPEGGDNEDGLKGCREILMGIDLSEYDVIACAVGTGTTLCGIADTVPDHIKVLGFAAMKNDSTLREHIHKRSSHPDIHLVFDEIFGGFGRLTSELQAYMHQFIKEYGFELDRVYTAKMMANLTALFAAGSLDASARVLAIHTGGLQGNRSLSGR